MRERKKNFGGKKGMVLGSCAMLAIFWLIWIKRNNDFRRFVGGGAREFVV